MDAFLQGYEHILHNIAQISALTLEIIGIIIIVMGSIKLLIHVIQGLIRHRTINIVVELGKSLSLTLEFIMGAEIIKTIVIHDLKDLAVLGIVVVIRILLTFIIHWEMKLEDKQEEIANSEDE